MPVATEIQPLLDALNAVEMDASVLTPEAMRAGLDGLWMSWAGDPPEMDTSNRAIPGPAREIPVRIYLPDRADPAPVIVALHGGGFVVGSLDSNDATCRHLASRSAAIVVSVDYRLAPEHPWPAGADDCLAAARWAFAHGSELGGDPERLVMAGDSAGANLASVCALRALHEEGPPIALQALLYPCFDPHCATRSHEANGRGNLLTTETMRWFWHHYLSDPAYASDPHVDPRRATDLSGLPTAVVITAEFDPLRDEGAEYADLLLAAGVSVDYADFPGMVHGFASMYSVTSQASVAIDRVAAAVRAL